MIALRARPRVLVACALTIAAAVAPLTSMPAARAAYAGTPLVAYTRLAVDGATTELWAASPGMADKRRVWRSATYNVEAPQLSQDATRIVFGARREAPFTSRIFTVRPDGTELTAWTTPAAPWIDLRPTWAPDRSAVYFTRLNVETGASSVLRLASAGAAPTAVPGTSGASFATVSPDGRYLAFDRRGSILVVTAAGEDRFVLRAGTETNGYHQPRWSPDGRSIAAVHDVRGSSMSLVVMHTSDAVRYTVTTHTPYGHLVGAPAWTHDSRQLYYSLLTGTDAAGYAYNLRRVEAVQGAASQPVTANPADGTWEWNPHLGGGTGPARDNTATPPIYGATTVELDAITLRYAAAPAAADASRFVVRYNVGAVAPATPSEGTLAYRGLRRTLRVSGLAPSTKYSFSVFTVDWSGNVSAAATKTVRTARPSLMAATTSAPIVTYGRTVQVSGLLTDAASGEPLAAKTIALYARPSGAAQWTRVRSTTTDALGKATGSHTPTRLTAYQWRFAGDNSQGPAVARSVSVAVRTRVTAVFRDPTIGVTARGYLSGGVAPGHVRKLVYLQRYWGGAWHTLREVALSATSRYTFAVRPGRAGKYRYRVVKRADADHATGVSAERVLTVS